MRVPLVGSISTKDGGANKNAKLVNMLGEEKKGGIKAVVRPALNKLGEESGNGYGMVCFGGQLMSVYGAELYMGEYGNIYTIDDLGSLGGTAIAEGISGNGSVIVGRYGALFSGYVTAFKYEGGVMTSLGMLDVDDSVARGASYDGSVIVGGTLAANIGLTARHAWKWDSANGMTDLGVIGGYQSIASDVSSDGSVICGYSQINSGSSFHACKWDSGLNITDMGTLGGDTAYSQAISSDGLTIAGTSKITGNSAWHAFKWTAGGGMVDLGTLGGTNSYAYGISSDGATIVGASQIAGNAATHAFIWTSSGGMVDIGSIPGASGNSLAYDANQDGSVIVGASTVHTSSDYHAFAYTSSNGFTNLGTLPGGSYSEGMGISDDGNTICGYSSGTGFVYHPFASYAQEQVTYTNIGTVDESVGKFFDFVQIP